MVNVLCVVHPNEERIGSYPMGRKMNRFQGEINDHILHKKMPNFQICSSNKKILPKVDWQFLGYRKARSFMYIIGETQRFTTKGWTETTIMLCKLNKSL